MVLTQHLFVCGAIYSRLPLTSLAVQLIILLRAYVVKRDCVSVCYLILSEDIVCIVDKD